MCLYSAGRNQRELCVKEVTPMGLGLISTHYITIFLVVLFGIKLYAQQRTRDVDIRFYWLTLFCCALLVVQDALEATASQDPELRFWRILLSVIGYVLRPTAAVGLLMVVCPKEKRNWKIWIPWGINLAANLTAFFSPVAFYFDERYDFRRGPLGYVVFIVSFIYMFQILYFIWKRFYEGKTAERWILIICLFGCMAASVVDAFFGGVHLTEAIMISSIFLYMYLRSHDNYLDPLTSLRNRFAFYDDIDHLNRDITAMASLDMNGLKALNDSKGHAEGDQALTVIGKCLNANCNRNITAYRVGGDEFTVLFMNQNEEMVRQTLEHIKEEIAAAGYSISVGYTMKTGGRSLDDVLHEADRKMYADKAAYYQQKGRDRRTRSVSDAVKRNS